MLLVSIHDVTPALESRVLKLWELCSSHGVVPALLVVPDWHGEWPLQRHPRFVRWLLDRAAAAKLPRDLVPHIA
jgi:predicted deacetylase